MIRKVSVFNTEFLELNLGDHLEAVISPVTPLMFRL